MFDAMQGGFLRPKGFATFELLDMERQSPNLIYPDSPKPFRMKQNER